MLVPLNSVYQLRLFGHIDSYAMENIFFYYHAAGDGAATELGLDFETTILSAITPLQVNDAVWDGIQVVNLGDLDDFQNIPLVTSGSYGAVPREPVFVAIGYSLLVNTRAVRRGSKRFAGIPSDVSNEEFITSAEYLADMEALRLLLLGNLGEGGDIYQPIVVKRTKTPITGTVPQQYRYNLPVPPASEATVGVVTAVTTSPELTSQVSRKG